MISSVILTTSGSSGERTVLTWLSCLLLAITAYSTVQLHAAVAIDKAVCLTWPESTTEEQIVTRGDTVVGPWVPVLEPVFKSHGWLSVAVPITSHEEWLDLYAFFTLVPGHQYANDFSNETGAGWEWNNLAENPGAVTHEFADGTLRVQDDGREAFEFPCPEPGVIYKDFALSVDIVDWNAADQGIGLHARTTLPTASAPGTTYGTVLTTKDSSLGAPGLFIWAALPDGTAPNLDGKIVEIDPAKNYRLVFTGVGDHLKAELYELPSLTLVQSVSTVNTVLSQGLAGLYFVDYRDTSDQIDITVDNLLITGTVQ